MLNQWFFGREAEEERPDGRCHSGTTSGGSSRKGDKLEIAGMEYDPVALLTLLAKEGLSLLSMEMSMEHIEAVMFTTAKDWTVVWSKFCRH